MLDPASGVKKLGKDVIIKKKFGLRMLILAMLLVSVAFVPAASAKADKASVENNSDSKVETYGIEGLTAQQVSTIEFRASYLSKLPNTVYNAPNWPMLAANDEEKKVYLSYIDKLSVSESEKKAMKKSMSDLWKRFPNGITEDDYPVIKKIGDAILDYLDKTNGEGKQSAQWGSTAHSDLISSGVNLKYKNSQWASWAAASAKDPDNGVIDSGSMRYYNHYYRPKIPYTGGATGRCLYFVQYAKSQDPNNANYFGKDTNVRHIKSKVLLEDAKYNAGLAAYISS